MDTLSSSPLATYEIATGKTATPGYLAAINSDGKVLDAEDAANLAVVGVFAETTFSAADDGTAVVDSSSIKSFANDTASAITRLMRGKPCYVKNAYTVSSSPGTNGIVAGIVVDVDGGDVFVDVNPAAVTAAKALVNAAAAGSDADDALERVAAAVAVLTDSSTGTAAATIVAPAAADYTATEHKANYASLAAKINSIISALKTAGLMSN